MSPKIILIHPPAAKCSELPAGIASLAGCLRANSIAHEIIDANLEGILFLLHQTPRTTSDSWTRRAIKHRDRNLTALKSIVTYQNQSRYERAVTDVNRLLDATGRPFNVHLSLADYQDKRISPARRADLIAAAEKPQDNPFFLYFQNRLLRALENHPDWIGFSVNYLSQALCAFAMIGFLRKIYPAQKIILGGSLVTSWLKLGTDRLIFNGLVDEIVEGAGEQKLLEILGVQNGITHCSPACNDFLLDQYLSPGVIIPYSSARGCYWLQCAFCPEKAEDSAYVPIASSLMIRDLETLTRLFNPALVHILNSSISPAQLEALAQNPPGAPWYGFARVTKHLSDEDFCSSLKLSGCKMLKLGIESGDQHVLDKLDKGIDLTTASAVLKTLKRAGIATYCYFLFGTPPENEGSALKTLHFVVEHQDCIDFLNLAIFNLPACSVEARSLATRDFYEGDLSLYRNFEHPLGWHRPNVRNFLEKTFKKHPAVAPLVKRTPVFFTSNHAPFFV